VDPISAASFSLAAAQYGAAAGFPSFAADHSSLYGHAHAAANVDVSNGSMATAAAAAAATIASFGFTQEQVACVCEVLEQSGNIDRLAR
jgi:hypothetical protein